MGLDQVLAMKDVFVKLRVPAKAAPTCRQRGLSLSGVAVFWAAAKRAGGRGKKKQQQGTAATTRGMSAHQSLFKRLFLP